MSTGYIKMQIGELLKASNENRERKKRDSQIKTPHGQWLSGDAAKIYMAKYGPGLSQRKHETDLLNEQNKQAIALQESENAGKLGVQALKDLTDGTTRSRSKSSGGGGGGALGVKDALSLAIEQVNNMRDETGGVVLRYDAEKNPVYASMEDENNLITGMTGQYMMMDSSFNGQPPGLSPGGYVETEDGRRIDVDAYGNMTDNKKKTGLMSAGQKMGPFVGASASAAGPSLMSSALTPNLLSQRLNRMSEPGNAFLQANTPPAQPPVAPIHKPFFSDAKDTFDTDLVTGKRRPSLKDYMVRAPFTGATGQPPAVSANTGVAGANLNTPNPALDWINNVYSRSSLYSRMPKTISGLGRWTYR